MDTSLQRPQRTPLGRIIIIAPIIALVGAFLCETVDFIVYLVRQLEWLGDSSIFYIAVRFFESIFAVLPCIVIGIFALKRTNAEARSPLAALSVFTVYNLFAFRYFGWMVTNLFCNTAIFGWSFDAALGFWFGEDMGFILTVVQLVMTLALCLPTTVAAIIASFRKISGKFFIIANLLAAVAFLSLASIYLVGDVRAMIVCFDFGNVWAMLVDLSRVVTTVVVFAVLILKQKAFKNNM